METPHPLMNHVRRENLSRRAFLGKIAGLIALPTFLVGCETEKIPETTLHTIEMISEGGEEIFVPDRIQIAPGDTVRWVLASGFHTTTAYHPEYADKAARIPQDAMPWDSGLIRSDGEIFEQRFEIEGTYCYYCTPHEALGMLGVVVVGKPVVGEAGLSDPSPDLPKAAVEKLNEYVQWANSL